MADYRTNHGSQSRKERVEIARSRDILDVARELNMDLVRSGKDYRWKEHDSLVISPDKNLWKWFSRHQGGDVIALVETLKEVDFNQAIDFLNDGDFKEYTHQVRSVEAFNYYLKPYEQEFNEGRDYLKQERGLSDETIDFFVNQGVIGQANAKLDYFSEATEASSAIEPVIVFKSLDSSGELVGATLQGIQEDWNKWPKHGYAKVIMRNSDPMTGVHVDIGQPNRLVFAESPIDLMSYYELNKDKLQDVRLVSMDGLKESTISRHLAQLEAELSNRQLTWSAEQLSEALKVAIDRGYFNDGKHQDLITLAVDNDEAGQTFIQELRELGAPINTDLPELQPGQDKTDWNDALKASKVDNSRLGRARRKLDRLQGELEEATHAAFDHQRQTNGQPMNDKRGGSAFFKRHEQLVDRAIAKTHEIEAQQDRIEKLEWQEANKAAGLNRSGSGLDLSVSNIPRIKEEIEKFNKGESVYTRDTIRKYEKRLIELEAMADFANKTQLSPGAQALVEQGLVNQWQKQPTIYFVKGLRKVALELNEAGEFEVSSKFSPKSAADQDRVNELVQASRHQGEPEMSESLEYGLPETHKEKSSEQTKRELHRPEDELLDITEGYLVRFHWAEGELQDIYEPEELVPYQEFATKIYQANDVRFPLHKNSLEVVAETGEGYVPYRKVSFDILDKDENLLFDRERYYVGEETTTIGQLLGTRAVAKSIQEIDAKILEQWQQPTKQSLEKTQGIVGNVGDLHLVEDTAMTIDTEKLSLLLHTMEQHGSAGVLDPLAYGSSLNAQIGDAAYAHLLDGNYVDTIRFVFDYAHKHFEFPSFDEYHSIKNLNQYKKFENQVKDFPVQEVGEKLMEEGVLIDTRLVEQEKSLELAQGKMKDRASGGEGYLQLEAEGSTKPVTETATFGRSVTSRPTSPYHYLQFSTNYEKVQRRQSKYHPISQDDLRRMNQYAASIQRVSQWYLEELSDTHVTYFYSDNGQVNALDVNFKQENFLHLTGIRPIVPGKQAKDFVVDFAQGYGDYNQILVSNNLKDKLQVLPMLEDILDPKSFVLDNLEEVRIAKRLDFSEAIKSKEEDFLLLFKDIGEEKVPASLMKIKGDVKVDVDKTDEKIILGVYRNRDGVIDQLSINEDYIKDGGQEMLDILKNKQYSEIVESEVEAVQSSSAEPEEVVASPVDIAGQTIDEIPVREITPEKTAYVYAQARQNDEVIQHGELYWKEHAEVVVASFREDNAIAFTSQKKLSKKEIAQRTEELLAEHPELEWTRPYSSAESFVDVRGVRQRIHQAGEPVLVEQAAETLVTATVFTQVLDAAYNVGVPDDLTNIPEEFHPAWNQYKTYAATHDNDLKQIVAAADKDNLLDKTSSFYKDWTQDQIYQEQYHVRMEFAEDWKERGPQLPFNTTDLIDYRTFAEELYRQNNIWQPRHLESLKNEDPVGNNVYIPYTKVYFDIYAPGGELVKKDVRYSIAEEDRPISQLLGLGYRRLEGYPALAAIDQEILEQLNQEEETQTINQEIAQEVSEPVAEPTQEAAEELSEARNFISPKQETRESLAKVVEEIVGQEIPETPDIAHQSIASEQQEVSVASSSAEPIDYTKLTPYELSEVAFQKVREFTQSPEALMEYLEFMSKFPQLSPRNAALIQAQWPGANAVATYKQWQGMGETLGISPEDVYQTTTTYTNKRTGETREVVHDSLSVKAGEKAQIVLFRPIMEEMIPVFDAEGNQVRNDLGNPKFKSLKFATPEEKKLLKEGHLKSYHFQKRNVTTGEPLFTTYKVFELSQTTLKEEAYPKAMPNRHYNFEMDKVKAREVTEGLCDYAESLGVELIRDEANQYGLGNSKGRYYVNDQKIVLNKDNTAGEQIGTLIHELAHATLHDPKRAETYKDVSKSRKELEAEMTSHLVSKHFGLDTSEKAINYMATWTNNLSSLDDKQLTESMKRIHNTVSRIVKSVEKYTKPYGSNLQIGQQQGLSQKQTKGPKM